MSSVLKSCCQTKRKRQAVNLPFKLLYTEIGQDRNGINHQIEPTPCNSGKIPNFIPNQVKAQIKNVNVIIMEIILINVCLFKFITP